MDRQYRKKLELLSKLDKNYRSVSLIVSDSINDVPVFLIFGSYYYNYKDDKPNKIDFVFQTDIRQREYLETIFKKGVLGKDFSAYDGNYKMFYPVRYKDRIVVLYFQDSQNYGKLGS